jgi:hypothetical protein
LIRPPAACGFSRMMTRDALYSCDKIGEHDVRDLDSLVVAFRATRADDIVKGRRASTTAATVADPVLATSLKSPVPRDNHDCPLARLYVIFFVSSRRRKTEL